TGGRGGPLRRGATARLAPEKERSGDGEASGEGDHGPHHAPFRSARRRFWITRPHMRRTSRARSSALNVGSTCVGSAVTFKDRSFAFGARSMIQTPAQKTPKQQVGRYAIFDEIAAGGMATVHLARFAGPLGFSRVVAAKRLHPHLVDD